MSTRNLDAFFTPGSLAIAGASDRQNSVGWQIARNVRDSFKGAIAGVNPRLPVIDGIAMTASVSDLPSPPDLAIIATPAPALVATVEAFAAKGTRAAIVVTDARRGDDQPSDVRAALRAIARRTGMRIAGPNALGFSSPVLHATMSSLRAPPGAIAFVGQATMAIGAIAEWTAEKHLGFSGVAAAGDMVDVDFGDLIDWFAADARTRVIVVVMDAVIDAGRFLSAMRQAARLKPVIVLRTTLAAPDARHDAVFEAALRRVGALCIDTLEDLFAAVQAVAVRLPSDAPPTIGRRLAILSNGASLAGLGRVALDDAEADLALLEDATRDRLAPLLPPGASVANPLDILPDATASRFAGALSALLEDHHTDAVLTIFGPSGSAPAADIAEAVAATVATVRRQAGRRRPFVMTAFAGGAAEAAARDRLNADHIPAFDTPSAAVRAYMALLRVRHAAQRVTATPEFIASPDDQLAANVERLARTALANGEPAIAGPVAAAIRRALWIGRADRPGTLPWRVEIATDPHFGPAIFFGPGGPFASIARPLTAALPPLNAAIAQDLIAASPFMRAAIGQNLLDDAQRYALAALLVRVSDLIAAAPSIRGLVIDGITAEKGRPAAPAAALSGHLAAYDGAPDARFAIRPYPAHLAEQIAAADGSVYRLRPMRAEDEPALVEFGTHLSPEDLRLRFFQPMRTLSHDMAVRLTHIDYAREMAFALMPPTQDRLLGVVRLHRETGGESGEFAITIRSDQQGRGLGRLLMEKIIAYARAEGLATIFGIVLAENRGMLKLARALSFKAHSDPHDAGIVRVELPLGP